MRFRLLAMSLLLVACGMAFPHKTFGQTYYLALGDSLAVGYQPSPSPGGATNQGYADDLSAQLSKRIPNLVLVKLGCSGENTSTMINGGICVYPGAKNQLEAAVDFLQANAGKVALVTLDIGADDVDHCISTSGIDSNCVRSGMASVGANLPYILQQLRRAAGHRTPIVGMNYYDPFLAAWVLAHDGQTLAIESLGITTDFNLLLGADYSAFDIPVADVAHAFRTYNLLPVPEENVPVDVFVVVSWTWMVAPPPIGPDVHPNAAGYAAIAGAFASKIGL